MSNYSKISIEDSKRVELHDKLKLTGAEISINHMPAGTSVPFIHYHKQNEEIYGILEGKGHVIIDDERIEVQSGDWLRIEPSARRQFFASEQSDLVYICVQVKENSLEGYSKDDGIIVR